MSLFFSADHHFGHKRILELDDRPFSSIEENDETLISNWNKCVGPNDEVWYLGDFSFRDATDYLKRLNGRIHLVRGNHDDKIRRDGFVSIQEAAYLRRGDLKIYLSHYACRVWRNSHWSWHLYAHSHGSLPPIGLSMDVGVKAVAELFKPEGQATRPTDYRPISLTEVSNFMRERKCHDEK